MLTTEQIAGVSSAASNPMSAPEHKPTVAIRSMPARCMRSAASAMFAGSMYRVVDLLSSARPGRTLTQAAQVEPDNKVTVRRKATCQLDP